MATNNSINAGNDTSGKAYQAKGAASPDFSTATYPATTTANQILYSSAANTVAGMTTGNTRILKTDAAALPGFTIDYALANWSPTLKFGGGNTGLGYSFRAATYMLIGKVYHVAFQINLSSKGSSTGDATLSLPFSSTADTTMMANDIARFDITLDANYTGIYIRPQSSAYICDLRQCGSGQAPIALDDTNFANNTIFSGSFLVYEL